MKRKNEDGSGENSSKGKKVLRGNYQIISSKRVCFLTFFFRGRS